MNEIINWLFITFSATIFVKSLPPEVITGRLSKESFLSSINSAGRRKGWNSFPFESINSAGRRKELFGGPDESTCLRNFWELPWVVKVVSGPHFTAQKWVSRLFYCILRSKSGFSGALRAPKEIVPGQSRIKGILLNHQQYFWIKTIFLFHQPGPDPEENSLPKEFFAQTYCIYKYGI